jgi:hypothetical protein
LFDKIDNLLLFVAFSGRGFSCLLLRHCSSFL